MNHKSASDAPVCKPLNERRYTDAWPRELCEHCDGTEPTRLAYLRGWTCKTCDDSLDEMLGEGSYQRTPQQEQELDVMRSRGEI